MLQSSPQVHDNENYLHLLSKPKETKYYYSSQLHRMYILLLTFPIILYSMLDIKLRMVLNPD